MKMLNSTILLLTILIVSQKTLLSQDLFFNNQVEFENWGTGKTVIDENVTLDFAINSLTPLSQLTNINGSLTIQNTYALDDLSGLENLQEICGALNIINSDVKNITALYGICILEK